MSTYTEELGTERAMKDQFMTRHPESPFVEGSVFDFEGLHYFPADESYRVPARLERLATPQEAYLRTNRDGQSAMRWVGTLRFRLHDRELTLRVYHAGEGVGVSVFVPFRDATSGRETYGAGRYLTLELNEADDYELDFNRAFNPYCAYTDAYECGFPPAENDLPVAVRAGEKVWSAARNPRTPSSAVIALLPPRPESAKTAKPSKRATKSPARASGPRRTIPAKPKGKPKSKRPASRR
jgi:uncharacterized protein (DUF1684 family)